MAEVWYCVIFVLVFFSLFTGMCQVMGGFDALDKKEVPETAFVIFLSSLFSLIIAALWPVFLALAALFLGSFLWLRFVLWAIRQWRNQGGL